MVEVVDEKYPAETNPPPPPPAEYSFPLFI
jgi:hypothetical protein